MAGSTHLVTINLGSQTVSVGDFRAQSSGGLILRAFRRRDVPGETATDPARLVQVTQALREMLHELGIGHTRVNYAVPAQSTFARFVKLPAVEEEKIERIIAFEAQQNVPFPIEKWSGITSSSGAARTNSCRSCSSRSNPICSKA